MSPWNTCILEHWTPWLSTLGWWHGISIPWGRSWVFRLRAGLRLQPQRLVPLRSYEAMLCYAMPLEIETTLEMVISWCLHCIEVFIILFSHMDLYWLVSWCTLQYFECNVTLLNCYFGGWMWYARWMDVIYPLHLIGEVSWIHLSRGMIQNVGIAYRILVHFMGVQGRGF